MAAEEEVKYLTFIQRSAASVYGYAEASYAKLKTSFGVKAPHQFTELFESVESRLKPVLNSYVIPYSRTVLKYADSLVRLSLLTRRCCLQTTPFTRRISP
jgi:hypothetical protein